MKENVFLAALVALSSCYRWKINARGEIRATERHVKHEFDPITAVCRAARKGTHKVGYTYRATERLKFSDKFQCNVIDAIDGVGNRGYSQILRGRIKSVLNLK